jgi:hypothetical protein
VRDPKANAFKAEKEYQQLIDQLVGGENPPAPEQLTRFYDVDGSFCGNGTMDFYYYHEQAILLAYLRNRRFGEAAKMVLEPWGAGEDHMQEDLVTAFGFDWHRVVAGAWLNGKSSPMFGNGVWLDRLCRHANDEAAQLVLRWAQLHWDEEVAKRGDDRQTPVYSLDDTPQLPSFELLDLLNPGNAVADPMRERIAAFLNANGKRLYDIDVWIHHLSGLPKGTASWLRPLLRAGLQNEKNEVRSLAERMLHEAGEPEAKAELREPPGFRLFVNGQTWPDFVDGLRPRDFRPDLDLYVEYSVTMGITSRGGSSAPNGEGIIKPDPDAFIPPERVRRAYFHSCPSSIGPGSSNPRAPWIRAEIPLPPAFGATTDIRVDTVAVTIQPRFPRPLAEYKGKVTWVEFGFTEDGRSNPRLSKYRLEGNGPLVLTRVQPGDYVVRVRAPGAAQTPLQKVSVRLAATRIEPKLMIGATVTVPVTWGDGFEIDALEPDMASLLLRRSWTGASGPIRVERNGVPFTDLGDVNAFPSNAQANKTATTTPGAPMAEALPGAVENNNRDKMILSNLPIGKYVVRLQSSADLRSSQSREFMPDGAHAGWKKGEVSFEVTARSPAEFTGPSLRVDPSR